MEDFKALTTYIRNRRSVYPKQYINKEIESDLLMEILENANHAPTHRLTQPWRFKIVTGQEKTRLGSFLADKYKELTPSHQFMPAKFEKNKIKCEQADKIMLVCYQRDPKESVPEWEEIAATAMAVQNIYLSCSALGIGCYWSTPKAIDYIKEFCQFEPGETCIGLFFMGYTNPQINIPASPRNPIIDKIDWLE